MVFKIRKKLNFFILFITILYLSSSVNATVVKQLSITDTVLVDKSINEFIEISIENNDKNMFSFALPDNSEDIIVNGESFGNNNTLDIPLSCTNCKLKISYKLKDIVKEESNKFIFSRTLNFPDNPLEFNYTIILPEGYLVNPLNNKSIDPDIVPNPSTITSNGNNILISWNQKNPKLPQVFFIRYKMANTNISKIVNYVPFFFIFTLLGIIIGYFMKLKFPMNFKNKDDKYNKEKIPSSYVIPSSLLSPDEKTIIELLGKNKNVMNQKEVVKALEWSKSKVSSIMTNLEYKKVIEREKFGRNHKVKLVQKISE